MKDSYFDKLERDDDFSACGSEEERRDGPGKTEMAEIRTTYARTRTLMAAERTYSAWIRTGFTVSTAGVTIGKILRETTYKFLTLTIGTTLIVLGIATFIYAWVGFYQTYCYIRDHYEADLIRPQSFMKNLFSITVFSVLLMVASVLGFWLMIN